MTKEQAVAKLASFHTKSSEQAILNAFINLQNLKEGDIVIFETSVSKSAPCLKIECQDKDGKWLSTSLIDEQTGQPIGHVS